MFYLDFIQIRQGRMPKTSLKNSGIFVGLASIVNW
jgi:hypothetical protein